MSLCSVLKSDVMRDLMTSRGLRSIPQETVYCTLPHEKGTVVPESGKVLEFLSRP